MKADPIGSMPEIDSPSYRQEHRHKSIGRTFMLVEQVDYLGIV